MPEEDGGSTRPRCATLAASHWGWPLEVVPERPHVTVHRHRRLTTDQRSLVVSHQRDLGPHEVGDGWVNSPERTVIDCCLDLPWDEALGIVLEADSVEFHGNSRALDRDCRRDDRIVVNGWLVLRFSWEMVMTEPPLVRQLIADAVDERRRVPRRPRRVGPTPT